MSIELCVDQDTFTNSTSFINNIATIFDAYMTQLKWRFRINNQTKCAQISEIPTKNISPTIDDSKVSKLSPTTNYYRHVYQIALDSNFR